MTSNQGRIVFAGLMPHAPVLIPEVGQGRERESEKTVEAMRNISNRVIDCQPDALIVVSPHSPRRPGAFGIWSEQQIAGDLGRFGCSAVEINLPNEIKLATDIATKGSQRGIDTWRITNQSLDHGASVPLYFLTRAGWSGPTVLLSLNYPNDGGLIELGETVRAAVIESGRRVAFIASGDMSHALKPGAPAGFQPLAAEFDRTFVEIVKAGAYRDVCRIDPDLQELAAEDVVDSTLIAGAAVDWRNDGHEFLSYEGPFGVGYSVAVLFSEANHE